MPWPCQTRTSTWRSFATISSGLYRFLAIAVLRQSSHPALDENGAALAVGARQQPPGHFDNAGIDKAVRVDGRVLEPGQVDQEADLATAVVDRHVMREALVLGALTRMALNNGDV